ncbi:MAG: type IX secretion system membrane protein PorP/SprF [Bacteroidia bacterium]|nr:type IX secretion system membrane protein PorP/SprF [Bacteroidia bacterium]
MKTKFLYMKKLVIFLWVLGSWLGLHSQQLPMYSQYVTNYFLLNPAVAGSENYTSLRFTSRQQWVGLQGAPSTQVLSLQGRIGAQDFYDRKGKVADKTRIDGTDVVTQHNPIMSGKVGIGGFIFNDKNGPISRTGIQLAYSYNIPFYQYMNRFNKPAQLSIGASASIFQMVVDESAFTLYDANDPVITGAKESTLIPDANFGLLFYNTNYYTGFSISDIFQTKMRLPDLSKNDNTMIRHYFMMGGYKYELIRDIVIEPSILFKATKITPLQVDLTTMLHMKTISFGVSYRTNNDIIGLFDAKVGRYYFGYSFDYSFGNIITYSSGTHEIVLGMNIGESVTAGIKDKKE